MPPALRRGSSADCDQIVEVFLACWRANYPQILPADLVQSMTEARARALWEQVLSTQDGDEEVIVAIDAGTGTVAGVVRCGFAHPGHGIVWSLYVDPVSQGYGIGSCLLRAAESALASGGASSASLWVFTANTASVAFYAHHGWVPVSENQGRSWEFGEPVHRLSKSFPDAATPESAVGVPRTSPKAAGAATAGVCS
jgi:GNAT superfamily N-acetyltransferase